MSVERSALDVERSAPKGAVFLSYAREDTDAARRIADALRSQGVEAWFDQAELRGGDAWDAKIKQQIRECALFLAVVSAHTQERTEGYFRREWKLAVERTHDMAAGVAFLVPVVIDDTVEVEALAPEEFMRVQWTRLPGALPTPEFVAQVKNLLGGGVRRRPSLAPMETAGTAAPMRTRPPMTPLAPPAPKPAAPKAVEAPAPPKKSGRRPGLGLGLVVVLLGAGSGAYFFLNPPEPAAPPPRPVVAKKTAPAAPAGPVITDKSIAVLPFTNMSEEKDSAFFTDGIQEDILTNLALIRELRVVSRTSVMQYRGTTKTMKQLAQELGVTYILEGSVRRAGNKVRVTGQLIHTATDKHVWAQAYDRDLTDVFAIQSELSQQIAAALKTALSPEEKSRIARAPTTNLAAYEAYLKATEISEKANFRVEELIRAEALLQTAVELDSKFTAAWSALSGQNLSIYFRLGSRPAERPARLEKAKQAVEMVEKLAPNEPETWLALGSFYSSWGDLPRSEKYVLQAAEALPNNAQAIMLLADMDARHGRYRAALARYQQAFQLDRQHPVSRKQLVLFLIHLRRYEEVEAILKEFPDPNYSAGIKFRRTGDGSELAQLGLDDPTISGGNWAWTSGDAATYVQQVEEARRKLDGARFDSGTESRYMLALLVLGETGRARELAQQALERNPRAYLPLALLGRKQEAVVAVEEANARQATEGVMPYSFVVVQKAQVFTWSGDKEQAIAEIARLLQTPSALNVHVLRRGVAWRPLQGDPRFEALLNDPKNNAPLF